MFDKLCKTLCIHTRKARIAFFTSLSLLMAVTLAAALYLYEPQPVATPASVREFNSERLVAEFAAEFGVGQGSAYFALARETAVTGNTLLQAYYFVSGNDKERELLTGEQTRQRFARLKESWDVSSPALRASMNPYVRAVAEDIEEGLGGALQGLARGTAFASRPLVKARAIFHDLGAVLLSERGQSPRYYGKTRLGQLVEKEKR